ncbi:MAG: NAD(P)H-dependent oxidoreductase [Ideonella sp.]|nr:NAD(P)H-dependent oxidoreductase [Ideonella sp.]MCC7457753.1 NAD(P)H-dependent oxidoreductase [Nitrospira sp.]
MKPCKVAALVGSLRKDSHNKRLLLAVTKLAPAHLTFETVRIDDLPLYSQDFDGDYPPNARRLKRDIESAQALLFVTPEYNRSVPGVLKNAIDIASRPWGTNSFKGKPAAVIGASIGAVGTAVAQDHLRGSLHFLDVPTLGQPEVYLQARDGLIAPDGTVTDESTRKFLQGFVDAYAAWVERFVAK